MVIFHSYVKLPEGIFPIFASTYWWVDRISSRGIEIWPEEIDRDQNGSVDFQERGKENRVNNQQIIPIIVVNNG